jgi:hypothetical protein
MSCLPEEIVTNDVSNVHICGITVGFMVKGDEFDSAALDLCSRYFKLDFNDTMWPNTVDQLKLEITAEKTGAQILVDQVHIL